MLIDGERERRAKGGNGEKLEQISKRLVRPEREILYLPFLPYIANTRS